MGRALTLISYKLRFFFGPSFRGRYGALVYLALVLVFLPSGYFFGQTLGMAIVGADLDVAIGVLAAPLSAILSFGLLYSLGNGVTAHPSEFDFFMTADLRPREYLTADLVFQFTSLLVAGGMAAVVAALAMVVALGQPLALLVPLLMVLLGYAVLVLMVSQILVVLRVRHPKKPIRSVTLVLIALSLLPSISIADPGFPLHYLALPFPSTAFASLGYVIVSGNPVDPAWIATAGAYLALVVLAWTALSRTYIFHGVRPTLSAGFGQVDISSRTIMQQRMIGAFGRVTTRVRLRTDRGGETGLMARLHLIRIWRDGSVLFVGIFAVVAIAPVLLGGGQDTTATRTIGVTQVLTFLTAILAMNWSYYERENLWIVLTGPGRAGGYFRGLMLSLAAVGLIVSLGFLGLFAAATAAQLRVPDVALPVASPIAAAMAATALLTRVRIKPAAFSPAILVILFLVSVAGFLGGLVGQGLLLGSEIVARLAGAETIAVLQAFVLFIYAMVLSAIGMWAVTRLSAAFRL